jgi:transcriptional regulator with XRE-family HTH domain
MEAEQPYLAAGTPELTDLGRRIEMLRIQRGLSKQYLARFAGTSRQQLWRVMTGKSPLTDALRGRLAAVLGINSLDLGRAPATATVSANHIPGGQRRATDFRAYVMDPAAIARTLASMPTGDRGRALKRRLLDAVEDGALDEQCALHPRFFDLRRQVLNGEL